MKFCEVSRNSILNRCWKFQLSVLKNKKVLSLKKCFLGCCQYQNKKALFTDSIFWKVLAWTFEFYPYIFIRITLTGHDGLWQKMCQISVTFWIFNDPIHIHKGTSIGHFGSRALQGDEINKIRKFLRKKGLLMSLRPLRLLRLPRLMRLPGQETHHWVLQCQLGSWIQ